MQSPFPFLLPHSSPCREDSLEPNEPSINSDSRYKNKTKWNGNGACVPRCGMKALTCCYLACFFSQLRRLWALLPTPSPSPLASRSRLARETLVSSASIEFWSMTVDITALTQVRQLAQSAEKLLIGWQNKQPVSSIVCSPDYVTWQLWEGLILPACLRLLLSDLSYLFIIYLFIITTINYFTMST